jgi:hypothetical protein
VCIMMGGLPVRVIVLADRSFMWVVRLLERLTGHGRASSFNSIVPMPPDGLRCRSKHGTVYQAMPARARRLTGRAMLGLGQKAVSHARLSDLGLFGHLIHARTRSSFSPSL